jgi:ATP-dependent Lhr-like helicase
LVLHAPFGSRINKAWGLALRKRFCRQFNFELQAAATEDALLLSLGPQHSFPLSDVFRYLHPETTRDVLVQAFLDAPVFKTRWRWNTTVALAVPRSRGGRKVAPQLQRMLADDLMAAVFPDAAACLENIPGDRQIPDHPLVGQTVRDCLQEAMDFEGLRAVLDRIHRGDLRLIARDTPEPSVFAHEILNAKPYAFLDDAPLEERRAHAVQSRRAGDVSSAGDLGALDEAAIDRVREEERPDPRDAHELHDTLMSVGLLFDADLPAAAHHWLEELRLARRATPVALTPEIRAWVAAERLPEVRAMHPNAAVPADVAAPPSRAGRVWQRDEAARELLRGRLTISGPVTALVLGRSIGLPGVDAEAALLALEAEGAILRGRFSPGATGLEWCDRSLLARIHRYTLTRLRAEIEPVSAADFMRFLLRWQHVAPGTRLVGLDGLREVLAALDGFEAAAGAWENGLLRPRLEGYDPSMLDMLCLSGEVAWGRVSAPSTSPDGGPPQLTSATPIAIFLREHREAWQAGGDEQAVGESLRPGARAVLAALRQRGPSFLGELATVSGLDRDALRHAVGALVATGLAASDGFAGLRGLLSPEATAQRTGRGQFSGRWTATGSDQGQTPSQFLPPPAGQIGVGAGPAPLAARERVVETQAWALLRRYGVVFRRLLAREPQLAPWRELTRFYRRLEARGEIRGGRFVSGMSGEQFALPDAIDRLREVRRTAPDGRLIAITTADPLNLAGVLTPGERVRAAPRNTLVYRDGIAVAVVEGEFTRALVPLDAETTHAIGQLSRRSTPALVR